MMGEAIAPPAARPQDWLPRPVRSAAAMVLPLALATLLQACAASGGGLFHSSYDDVADPCNYARQPLLESRTTFAKSIITGAATMFQGMTSSPGPSAGPAPSSPFGAIGSYFAAKAQQFRTQTQLIASIDRDAAADNSTLIGARNAVGTLTRCRRKQAADIDRDYRAHRISNGQARGELEIVRQEMRTDDQLISDVLGKVGDRSRTYADAKREAAGQTRASTRRAAPASSGATGALQQTERQTQEQQTEHRDVDNGLQKRINDLSAVVG